MSSPDLQSGGVAEIHQIEYMQASGFLIGGNSIVSIQPIGVQPVLDFTVEDTGCYFAGGMLHHNTEYAVMK